MKRVIKETSENGLSLCVIEEKSRHFSRVLRFDTSCLFTVMTLIKWKRLLAKTAIGPRSNL